MNALHKLEESGDTAAMVDCFAEQSETHAMAARRDHTGRDGAEKFWNEYRGQFDKVHSDFSKATVEGNVAVLEWTGKGTLKGTGGKPDRDISYEGCSILHFNDAGKVERFRTFYDSAAFISVEADTK